MHSDAFHLSLTLIRSLVPVLVHVRVVDADLAKHIRTSAASLAQSLVQAELAASPALAARHRQRAAALATEVHAALLIADAWHFFLPADRATARQNAQALIHLLAAA